MQKILRRTELAKRQAARVKLREEVKKDHDDIITHRKQTFEIQRMQRKSAKAAHLAYREDWRLGPLAPRRSVGEGAERYGTVDQDQIVFPKAPKSKLRDSWAVTEGDRVVCIRGRDRGKIGTVKDVSRDSNAVQVSGFNVADIYMPEWRRKADGNPRPYRTMEGMVHIDDIRLVFGIKNLWGPGTHRDVIARRVEIWQLNSNEEEAEEIPYVRLDTSKLEIGKDDIDYKNTFRVIPGLPDQHLPWPKKGKPHFRAYEVDTLRISSEEISFVPTLLSAPMPGTVIDELRNKYGKFRETHDESYIIEKLAEDEMEERKKQIGGSMKTPTMLLKEREVKKKQSVPISPLSESFLQAIGKVMADKNNASLL